MHSCLALLYPFKWQQIYAPMLPQTLLDYVTAPMPFVVGVHTSLFAQMTQQPLADAMEEELVFAKLDTEEVLLCGEVPSLLAKFPSSHIAALEKKVRRLVKDHMAAKPTITKAEFNRGISETFVEFMVSLFGKYRDFIQEDDYEFDIEGFTAAQDRTAATQVFLQQFRGSQMLEIFGRERAALFARSIAAAEEAAAEGGAGGAKEVFSLAQFDKFEALVEVEGEFVGMNWMEKVVAKRERQAALQKQAAMALQKQAEMQKQLKKKQTQGSGGKNEMKRVVVFESVGPLGISWLSRTSDDAAVVKALKANGQAAHIEGMCAGLVLRAVGIKDTSGLAYKEQLKLIRLEPRPMALTFEVPSIGKLAAKNSKLTRVMSDPGDTSPRQWGQSEKGRLEKAETASHPTILEEVGPLHFPCRALSARLLTTNCVPAGRGV